MIFIQFSRKVIAKRWHVCNFLEDLLILSSFLSFMIVLSSLQQKQKGGNCRLYRVYAKILGCSLYFKISKNVGWFFIIK